MVAVHRIPTPLQRLNQWLLPILVLGVLSAMGFYAAIEHGTSTSLATVAANQKIVMKNQDEMKIDINTIKTRQEEVRDALAEQTAQLRLDRIRITTLHHQKGIQTCSGCHNLNDRKNQR